MSDASVQRYRKEGGVSGQMHRLLPEVRARALGAPQELGPLLGRPSSACFPPGSAGRYGRRSFQRSSAAACGPAELGKLGYLAL
eukprot:3026436-Pyramimonas_sp.AAC.1